MMLVIEGRNFCCTNVALYQMLLRMNILPVYCCKRKKDPRKDLWFYEVTDKLLSIVRASVDRPIAYNCGNCYIVVK